MKTYYSILIALFACFASNAQNNTNFYLKGTFEVTLKDKSGKTVQIKNGKFESGNM